MTLTFEPDLDSVKLNRRAKYVGQGSFGSRHTDKHTELML